MLGVEHLTVTYGDTTAVSDVSLELRAALIELAAQHRETLFAAHTHTQPAQPSTIAHYLLAVIEPRTSVSRAAGDRARVERSESSDASTTARRRHARPGVALVLDGRGRRGAGDDARLLVRTLCRRRTLFVRPGALVPVVQAAALRVEQAAARVPVSKVSEAKVPPKGSSMWVCTSMAPGITHLPAASRVRSAATSRLVPIIAMGFSTVFEGYLWSPLAAAGGVLALAGLVIALRSGPPRAPSPSD